MQVYFPFLFCQGSEFYILSSISSHMVTAVREHKKLWSIFTCSLLLELHFVLIKEFFLMPASQNIWTKHLMPLWNYCHFLVVILIFLYMGFFFDLSTAQRTLSVLKHFFYILSYIFCTGEIKLRKINPCPNYQWDRKQVNKYL